MKYDATIKGCFIGPYLVFKFVKICERDLLIPPNTFPAKSVTQIHFPPKVMLRYSIIPLKKHIIVLFPSYLEVSNSKVFTHFIIYLEKRKTLLATSRPNNQFSVQVATHTTSLCKSKVLFLFFSSFMI